MNISPLSTQKNKSTETCDWLRFHPPLGKRPESRQISKGDGWGRMKPQLSLWKGAATCLGRMKVTTKIRRFFIDRIIYFGYQKMCRKLQVPHGYGGKALPSNGFCIAIVAGFRSCACCATVQQLGGCAFAWTWQGYQGFSQSKFHEDGIVMMMSTNQKQPHAFCGFPAKAVTCPVTIKPDVVLIM